MTTMTGHGTCVSDLQGRCAVIGPDRLDGSPFSQLAAVCSSRIVLAPDPDEAGTINAINWMMTINGCFPNLLTDGRVALMRCPKIITVHGQQIPVKGVSAYPSAVLRSLLDSAIPVQWSPEVAQEAAQATMRTQTWLFDPSSNPHLVPWLEEYRSNVMRCWMAVLPSLEFGLTPVQQAIVKALQGRPRKFMPAEDLASFAAEEGNYLKARTNIQASIAAMTTRRFPLLQTTGLAHKANSARYMWVRSSQALLELQVEDRGFLIPPCLINGAVSCSEGLYSRIDPVPLQAVISTLLLNKLHPEVKQRGKVWVTVAGQPRKLPMAAVLHAFREQMVGICGGEAAYCAKLRRLAEHLDVELPRPHTDIEELEVMSSPWAPRTNWEEAAETEELEQAEGVESPTAVWEAPPVPEQAATATAILGSNLETPRGQILLSRAPAYMRMLSNEQREVGEAPTQVYDPIGQMRLRKQAAESPEFASPVEEKLKRRLR